MQAGRAGNVGDMSTVSRRRRRTPQDAKREILAAAEQLLVARGPSGVTVRAVAERVGMTDAGVNHHFGSRDGLLEALLRYGGRRVRTELDAITRTWLAHGARLGPLVTVLSGFYRSGYGQLVLSLHAAGWRDDGSGMLQPVVDALHHARSTGSNGQPPDMFDTQLAIAALHQALVLEPTFGPAARRSTGIPIRQATDPDPQLQWWTRTMTQALGLPHE